MVGVMAQVRLIIAVCALIAARFIFPDRSYLVLLTFIPSVYGIAKFCF